MKKVLIAIGIICVSLFSYCGQSKNESYTVAGNREFSEGETVSGEKIKKEFKVSPGGTVDFDLHTGGPIEILGWDKDIVEIEIIQKDNYAEFTFDLSGNKLVVSSEYLTNRERHRKSPRIFAKVPSKFNSIFNTMGGEIKIEDVEGSIEGTTMGGAINIRHIKGDLDIKTMGGAIVIKDSEANGRAKTMGGAVLVENVVGDIDASSMGGKVQHINVTGKFKSVGREVDINTMGGDLDIDKAPNGAKLKTMGGDITVNSVEAFLDCETMGGDIKVKKAAGKVKAKTLGGDVEINMPGNPDDVKDVYLSSLGGDITLLVPDGVSADVEIDIEVTKNCSTDPKVISDFSLSEERTKDWEFSHGEKRKHIYNKGNLNGGKNKIKIKTINGNVYLKRS